MLIGYVTIGTNDLGSSGRFYDALLADLGATRVMADERMIGWGVSPGETMFSVITPFDGNGASVGNGVMVAFNVESPENGEKIYHRALSLGATDEGQEAVGRRREARLSLRGAHASAPGFGVQPRRREGLVEVAEEEDPIADKERREGLSGSVARVLVGFCAAARLVGSKGQGERTERDQKGKN